MDQEHHNPTSPEDYLYLLSWHDSLERLDMLILEIRHLQTNIIHSLRAPFLYNVLQKEEDHLWGKTWEEGLSRKRISHYDLAKLTKDCIPLFPNKFSQSDSDNGELINIWNSNAWREDQRRHYHLLEGLQTLKRSIFFDKLTLSHYAKNRLYKCDDSLNREEDMFSKFYILRSGISAHIYKYIQDLENYQSAYSKALDSGAQDHPRPSVERRRELGIYTDYLSDRCRDLWTEMRILMEHLGQKEGYHQTNVILHRWQHDYTSRTRAIDDEVAIFSRESEGLLPSRRFITTSYFMPERPDLQPIIAHEIAHCIIRDYMGDLNGPLHHSNGLFSDLISDIYDIFNIFDAHPGLPGAYRNTPLIDAHSLVREMAADMLAISAKGSSYLYALFLELFPSGLERILESPSGRIDPLVILEEPIHCPTKAVLKRSDWYLRLLVASEWLKFIHHGTTTELDSQLMAGVVISCEKLSTYLDTLVPDSFSDSGKKWSSLATQIVKLLKRHPATKAIKTWRKMRSKDEGNKDKKGARNFPRSTMRLSREIRAMTLEILRCEATKRHRKHIDEDEMLMKYGLYSSSALRKTPSRDNLYRHIYDIPWQSSLFRAIDFYAQLDHNPLHRPPKTNPFRTLHEDFSLGRDIFFFALDFYIWRSESAARRLISTVTIVREILSKTSANSSLSPSGTPYRKQLFDILRNWIDSTPTIQGETEWPPIKSIDDLIFTIQDHSDKPGPKLRKYERACGHILKDLFDKLSACWGEIKDYEQTRNETEPSIIPIYTYLSIRASDTRQENMTAIKSDKEYFFSTLKEAFLSPPHNISYIDTSDTNKLRELKGVLIGRISLSGPYSKTYDPKRQTKSGTCPPLFIIDMISEAATDFSRKSRSGDYRATLLPVLGRYDFFSIQPTSYLCRCTLPNFPNTRKNPNNEKCWPVFFLRREMAFEIQLSSHSKQEELDDDEEKNCGNDIAAFLVITLQKRSYRLDFIYRLIHAINEKASYSEFLNGDRDLQTIESIGRLFTPDDSAFLTDGWCDLVIAFRYAQGPLKDNGSASDRLSDIFKIQRAIYQDFMVDRTELILSTSALYVACNNMPDKWDVHIRIRLMEDNSLIPSNKLFKNHLTEVMEKWPSSIEINEIPGRMDFSIRFIKTDSVRDIFLELLGESKMWVRQLIDRVDTTIGKKLVFKNEQPPISQLEFHRRPY